MKNLPDLLEQEKLLEKTTFYGSRFASISLPARTPKGRFWKRSNGRDSLVIEAGAIENKKGEMEDLKVPSGIIPRRILIYLSHKWMEQRQQKERDRRIELGSCLYDFLSSLDLKSGGSTYKSIEEQSTRLFNAKIAFHSKSDHHYSVQQALVARKYELWWSKVENQESLFPSFVELSEDFVGFLDRSMPLNLETVQALGGNCLAFDLYVWLNLRAYSLASPITVKWADLHLQLGANYKDKRFFKRDLKKAWEVVQSYYQNNSLITEHGIQLIRSKPDIEVKNFSKHKSIQFLNEFGLSDLREFGE